MGRENLNSSMGWLEKTSLRRLHLSSILMTERVSHVNVWGMSTPVGELSKGQVYLRSKCLTSVRQEHMRNSRSETLWREVHVTRSLVGHSEGFGSYFQGNKESLEIPMSWLCFIRVLCLLTTSWEAIEIIHGRWARGLMAAAEVLRSDRGAQ